MPYLPTKANWCRLCGFAGSVILATGKQEERFWHTYEKICEKEVFSIIDEKYTFVYKLENVQIFCYHAF
jgi:hypothetical protein